MKTFDYSYEDIVASLKNVGIKTGDKIFIHSNLGFFGTLKDTNDPIEICTLFKKAIFEVIGKEGTLIVPTFSYSFTKNEIYDKNEQAVTLERDTELFKNYKTIMKNKLHLFK